LLIGALLIPVIGYVVAPAWKFVKGFLRIFSPARHQ
jgi:hypothetical protein